MRQLRDRKLTIGDAMILIAATAIGMAWHRAATPLTLEPGALISGAVFARVSFEMQEPLICLTVFWAILRLRRPRPPFRRMLQSPGAAMSIAAVIGLAAGLVQWIVMAVFRYFPSEVYWSFFVSNHRIISTMTFPAGSMAFGALVMLTISGQWRRGRNGLDRIGQVIGAFWVLSFVSEWLKPLLHHLAPTLW